MASTQKRKYIRSLALIAVLIGALWGGALFAHSKDVDDALEPCRPKPTPSATASPKTSPTVGPKISPTPSVTPKTPPLRTDCEAPGLFRLGLDLQGGISVVLTPKEGEDVSSGTLEKAIDIIRNRVDALGVAEPDISSQGRNVLIQLPGLKDQAAALRLIGTTAKLSFRPVIAPVAPQETGPGVPDCARPETYPKDEPEKEVVFCVRIKNETTGKDEPRQTWPKFRLGKVALDGSGVSTAQAVFPSASSGGPSGWQIDLSLNSDGGKKFEDITGKLACNPQGDPKRQLAIVLDRVVESSPQAGEEVQCNQGISGGNAQISGSFTETDAKDLALVLRYGALPVELEASTTTTVSPTLGKESLRSGLLAGAIGLAIVFAYVLLFYRALGALIWIGLAVHAAFTFAVVVLLGQAAGFALSLAGIAGLIVSLGIAADSFIVYFERIKDEVHAGKTVRVSVERAWQSARRTIVAADLVTALAATVLYFLAVGSVRGFALMLGLSTALDLFVSYLFMHPAVWLLAQTKVLRDSKTLGAKDAPRAPVVAGGPA